MKSSTKAISTVNEKFYEVEITFLIVSVVLSAMILHGFCDILAARFESDASKLKRTYRRQTEFLIFCLILYLAPVLALFSSKFKVRDSNEDNRLHKFPASRSPLRPLIVIKTKFRIMNRYQNFCFVVNFRSLFSVK